MEALKIKLEYVFCKTDEAKLVIFTHSRNNRVNRKRSNIYRKTELIFGDYYL